MMYPGHLLGAVDSCGNKSCGLGHAECYSCVSVMVSVCTAGARSTALKRQLVCYGVHVSTDTCEHIGMK